MVPTPPSDDHDPRCDREDEPGEGVIRFRHELKAPVPGDDPPLQRFRAARDRARALGVIGRDADRYGGLAYGNLSQRRGTGFWITASQRIDAEPLAPEDLVRVTSVTADGRVLCRGHRPPSSETLTHAAIHDAVPPGPLAVFHGHAPELWRSPPSHWLTSPPGAANGTVLLARAVREAVSRQPDEGWLVIGGHEDGILGWATDFDTILEQLEQLLAGC